MAHTKIYAQLDSATIEANTFYIPDSVTLNDVMAWNEMIFIYDKLFILEDSTGELEIEDVINFPYAKEFIPNPTQPFPVDKGTDPNKYYWVRIFFQANDLPFQKYMLGQPVYFDEITVYERNENLFKLIFEGGQKTNPSKKNKYYPHYHSNHYDDLALRFLPNERKELYLKLKPSTRFDYPVTPSRNPISVRIIAYEPNQVANEANYTRNLIFALIFLVMGIYHLVLFFSIKDKMYLYFSLLLLIAVFYIGNYNFIYLFFSAYFTIVLVKPLFFGGLYISLFLFAKEYLQIEKTSNRPAKSFRYGLYFIIIYIIGLLGREFIIYALDIHIRDHPDFDNRFFMGIAFSLFLFIISLNRFYQGFRPALILALAMAIFSFSNLINILDAFNIRHLPIWIIQIITEKAGLAPYALGTIIPASSLSFMLFVLAVGLSTRYNLIQKEKNTALQENLDLQIQVNQELQAKSQLEELNRMRSRFFANITHEFRTPLTVILGIANQIKGHLQQTRLIQRNGKRLLQLINQLLDLSKLEAGQLKLHLVQQDVIPFLRYLTESFHSLAETKNISLTFYSEADELRMDFDSEKLQQIVSNLLSNAIKYTPEGGKVIVHIKSEGVALHLKIQDNGKGISPEKLPYIFDRFYQVDDSPTRQAEGTGIGLALTKELVELMKGEVQAESKVGKGSSFTVMIPITQTAPLSEVPPTISSEVEDKASEIIPSQPLTDDAPLALIIEDNKDVVAYLQSCLQIDYQIEIAYDGEEGINKALKIVPDIIISDVMMPKKDGYEVCHTLKEDQRTSHIPIVMLTAKATQEDKLQGLQRGADAYLMKPFDPVELEVRLQKLLEVRKQLKARYQSGEPDQSNQFQQEDEFLQKLRAVIEENMGDETFGVEVLAHKMKLSRVQIHRKLKALTDQPTSHFIRAIRMQRAVELLKTTDLQVAEVAYKVGYSDPSYFTRQFVQVYRKRPSEVK